MENIYYNIYNCIYYNQIKETDMSKATYKNIDKYYATKRRHKKEYYSRTAFADNFKKKYSLEEIRMILEHQMTDMELSKRLGRSVKSIQSTRARYKDSEIMQNYIESLKDA